MSPINTIVPFSPSELPAVDEVHVRERGRWGKTIVVDGEIAQRIADLWRRLPPGRQMRCHDPTHELTFCENGKIVCVTTVCWECNNVYGTMYGKDIRFEFDSQAKVSQQLLEEIVRVNPGRRWSWLGQNAS